MDITCNICKEVKHEDNFQSKGRNRNNTVRRQSWCIPCHRIYMRVKKSKYNSIHLTHLNDEEIHKYLNNEPNEITTEIRTQLMLQLRLRIKNQ